MHRKLLAGFQKSRILRCLDVLIGHVNLSAKWLVYRVRKTSAEPLLDSALIQLKHDADGLAHARPMPLCLNLVLDMLDHPPVPAIAP